MLTTPADEKQRAYRKHCPPPEHFVTSSGIEATTTYYPVISHEAREVRYVGVSLKRIRALEAPPE